MKLFRGNKATPYYRQILAGLVLVPAIILSGSLGAHAAAPATPNAGSASGLSISPLRQELTLKPGQADKIDITLKNITGGPINAKVAVRDFESDNVTGNPKVITDPNFKSPASIRNFLVGLGDLPLAIGEQKTFSIPVQTPGNATPGAYYGLIEYQAVPSDTGTQAGNNKVALSAAVSQLVFITVPGNITERMQINAIHIYRDKAGANEGLFFTSIPQMAGIELRNLGNGFARPFGHIALQNSEGKEIYSYELNGGITRGLVLPNSTRIFKDPIKNITRPGRYTIVANISYGSGSAILTGKKTFWYIPKWVIVVLVVILLLLAGAVYLARRRYKRSTNRHHRY
jgi:hypothetical protein